jgi:hypothetical protein
MPWVHFGRARDAEQDDWPQGSGQWQTRLGRKELN